MIDTAVNIVDFTAYRERRRAAAKAQRTEPQAQVTLATFPMAVFGFWPVWVLMPVPVPAMFAGRRDAL